MKIPVMNKRPKPKFVKRDNNEGSMCLWYIIITLDKLKIVKRAGRIMPFTTYAPPGVYS